MPADSAGIALVERPAKQAGASAFSTLAAGEAETLAGEWQDLAGRASDDNVFFHPDFVLAAMANLRAADVAVAAVRDPAGRLVAAAPFTPTRLGHIAPAVRLWAHKYAPLGLPLVASDSAEEALAVLVDGLAPEGTGLSLTVPDLPGQSGVSVALVRHAERSGRPLAILDDHRRAILDRQSQAAADLRGALPARRRKELGRQMRRLTELGDVLLDSATGPDAVHAAFEEFLAVEKAGWKGRSGTALGSSRDTAEFARSVVARRAATGGVRIETIRLSGRPIAVVVSFIAGATAWTWKIAHDETFARFSPGAQLMLEAPARIFANAAIKRIDSCAVADHPMIDRLWPDRLAMATLVLGPRGGSVLNRVGLAAARAEIAARANMRHIRDRLA